CSDVQNGKLRCSWQTSLEKGNPFRVEIDLERPERFAGTQAVVRQLVGTTLGVLRHLVWTTLAPAERDHLVGGFLGSVS
ncbi:MAG: hypothetical protein KA973_19345, partial [Candidatus Microthrix sp.]|nr:hypothetical protein [Candidatus Microthrix sp.]